MSKEEKIEAEGNWPGPRRRALKPVAAVVIVIASIGLLRLWNRRSFCLERMSYHARLVDQSLILATRLEEEIRENAPPTPLGERGESREDGPIGSGFGPSATSRKDVADLSEDATIHARLREQFRRVASHPWEPIPIDPLPPPTR